jgi:serine/threonine-protein kinase
MGIASVATLVEALGKLNLLTPEQLQQGLRRLRLRINNPQLLARKLIEIGWLTPYQVNQLFAGHGKDLVLGQYVLLERLGEGGMGQVFKARHRKLDRVVGLKLIRKSLVGSPDLVLRFRQEIEAVAQLSHPNIVLAYDADEIDGVCFYTMEYVEGTTLGQLVKRSGPLPVSLACEYVRQAALGLQHAHERGLVHRDIKPSNLIQTWTSRPLDPTAGGAADERNRKLWGTHQPLIKILDMGLARVQLAAGLNASTGSLTEKGVLMGTPDYISPEQALNAHKVDIRSDLYSLGATLYFLVTGQPPFPGGTPMEKVIHHRLDEPSPMAKVRPGVAPEVQAIAGKLLAKQPEARYQTPAELASVLSVYLTQMETARSARVSSERRSTG